MRITKYGHACLLIEESEARLLIDPGAFSSGFEQLTDLDAILITHQHQDHCLADNIAVLLKGNPEAELLADEGSAAGLKEAGLAPRVVKAGDRLEVAGVAVTVAGQDHAIIHADIPGIPNVGYGVAEKFFYPGDSYTVPDWPVEVLAAPVGAPWLKIAEVVDYVRAIKPEVAIPVHDAVLAMPEMHQGILRRLTADYGVELRVVPNGQTVDL